jgi:S-DNA-T family DNA segregation ATPase FtsK/SpoIIIE
MVTDSKYTKNTLMTDDNEVIGLKEVKEEKQEKQPLPEDKPPETKADKQLLKLRRISGLFFLSASLFLLISFTSFLFTWKSDLSLVTDITLLFQNFNTFREVQPNLAQNWMGLIGAYAAHVFIFRWFGIPSFIFILLFLVYGIKLLYYTSLLPIRKASIDLFFILIWSSVTLGLFFHDSFGILGGAFGYYSQFWLKGFLGLIGTIILLTFSLLTFLVLSFNFSLELPFSLRRKKDVPVNTPAVTDTELPDEAIEDEGFENEPIAIVPDEETEVANEEEEPVVVEEEITFMPTHVPGLGDNDIKLEIEDLVPEEQSDSDDDFSENLAPFDPTLELAGYKFPTLDLLKDFGDRERQINPAELEERKNMIIQTLRNYNIEIDKIKATVGPTVTLYEIIPMPGVRISKIKNLEDDIALSLSALGIRIIAPIPGKGTIGIEVPNIKPEIVSLKAAFNIPRFQTNDMELPFVLGRTISNEVYMADLTKMPHLLIAGATGQGKSVGINVIITSLLYKKHPSQLKFVMVDPKKVELNLYQKMENHFLARLPDHDTSIITEVEQVVTTLNSLTIEMDARYMLLKEAHVRNIVEYNNKFIQRKLNPDKGHRYLPYIVLVIDELADLMMRAGKEVEMPIARIAQLARAIGIHLIIATQRPSVNVITGTIKANFPARVAYRVTSQIDSRTILDVKGAEQLVGKGDMLFSYGSDTVRIQCAFIETDEVERVVDYISQQPGYEEVHLLPEVKTDKDNGEIDGNLDELDPLFEDAARIVVQHQQGSTSLLQRRLKLGYNRAGRIIDQLEKAGVVGPFEGSKARAVRFSDEYALEQFLREYLLNP